MLIIVTYIHHNHQTTSKPAKYPLACRRFHNIPPAKYPFYPWYLSSLHYRGSQSFIISIYRSSHSNHREFLLFVSINHVTSEVPVICLYRGGAEVDGCCRLFWQTGSGIEGCHLKPYPANGQAEVEKVGKKDSLLDNCVEQVLGK